MELAIASKKEDFISLMSGMLPVNRSSLSCGIDEFA